MKSLLPWLLAALLLSGCSTIKSVIPGGDSEEEPAPLEDIAETVSLQRIWKVASGDIEGNSRLIQPVLAGSSLFAVSSAGLVTAVDTDSGETLWTNKLKLPVSAGAGYGDALVYIGADGGEVVALHAGTGEVAWRSELEGEILASPMAGEGTVVVSASVDRLIGLSSVDGVQKWSLRQSTPRLTLRGRSRPLVMSDIVFAGFENGKLLLLRLENGQILWEKRVGDAVGKSELQRLADIDSQPILIGDTVYAAAFQSRVVAIHAPSSRITWENKTSTYQDMAVDRSNIYVTDEDNVVVAIDRNSGLTAWRQEAFEYRGVSAPAVLDDYIVVGDKEGYMHLLDKQTGYQSGRVKIGSAIVSQPLVRGDTVFVQTVDGELSGWQLN
jgi:outer membrane protein assembly factor BamB